MNAEWLQNMDWQAILSAVLTTAIVQSLIIYALKRLIDKLTSKNEDTRVKAGEIDTNVERVLKSGDTLGGKLDKMLQLQKDTSERDEQILEYQRKGVKILVDKIGLLDELKTVVDNYLEED